MGLSAKALKLRIDSLLADANQYFTQNGYVTIHGHKHPVTGQIDPFKVWIDLNYPVYVERNKKPVKVSQLKGICIEFPSGYPKDRPVVRVPEIVVSVHSWGESRTLCAHTTYNSEEHTLIEEIQNIMMLCANCPETINYNSMTTMKNYKDWTENGLKNGMLPTVKKSVLLPICKPMARRTATGLRGLLA